MEADGKRFSDDTPPLESRAQAWSFPVVVFLLTCLGVFVLPFLLPPAPILGVSAANVAGFNNKVASLAAAILGTIVFLKELRWPAAKHTRERANSDGLSRSAILAIAFACAGVVALFCRLVYMSHQRYLGDAGYFIEQLGAHVYGGRTLYDQVEFPYGPLLFYGPLYVQKALWWLHLSLTGAYFSTLFLEHLIGMSLMGYVINNLPVSLNWKRLLLLSCVPITIELCLGLNYTFFRFAVPIAFVVFTSKRQRSWSAAIVIFIGQVVSLAISPEVGFAFLVAGIAYSGFRVLKTGQAWWLPVLAPFLSVAVFMVLVGGGYLRMLKLFAHGLFNFIVEPLPYILIFLFALVWLVPTALARFFREDRREAPMLGALYLYGLALLPVAFGRADPGHVLFNGLTILLLSAVAISGWSIRSQKVWGVCLVGIFFFTAYMDTLPFSGQARDVIYYDIRHSGSERIQQATLALTKRISPIAVHNFLTTTYEPEQSFDTTKLDQVIGSAKIAAPIYIPLQVEEYLKRTGRYRPSFYCFHIAVLDASAEERDIQDVNRAEWLLIPLGANLGMSETPETSARALGGSLPYHTRRNPYVGGFKFYENLKTNWQLVDMTNGYGIFKRKS